MEYVDFGVELSDEGGTWTAREMSDVGALREEPVHDAKERAALVQQYAVRAAPQPQQAGRQLARLLLPGPIEGRLLNTYRELPPGSGLRLRIIHKSRHTAALPWEWLCPNFWPPGPAKHAVLQENISIVRQHLSTGETTRIRRPSGLLRTVIASAHGAIAEHELRDPAEAETPAWFAKMQRKRLPNATQTDRLRALAGGAEWGEFNGPTTDIGGHRRTMSGEVHGCRRSPLGPR